MTHTLSPEEFLAASAVDSAVHALRPDYRAHLIVVDGIVPGAGDAVADELVARAEEQARRLVNEAAVEDLPHIAAWREAYRAFGAKPQRTRNSLEALTRRAVGGLPRVNPLTDIYNAVSVLHQIPLGGEDFANYRGPARLVRARGDERFDTASNGGIVIEHPDEGEVIWRDDEGVTCRRWNWRQGRRTALTDETRTAVFILDVLAPISDAELMIASEELIAALGGGVHASSRVLVA
ncbi:B3/4 domain-containing protein [Microbacterium sp. ZW T5_56]|uniref:B3/B4 domain-containing protein n=1 Tax=Microbacterium sp. ZW T5_56 TaxID=3378081 RepID=UPI003852FE35